MPVHDIDCSKLHTRRARRAYLSRQIRAFRFRDVEFEPLVPVSASKTRFREAHRVGIELVSDAGSVATLTLYPSD
jgi:hypothetical protein